MSSIKEVNSEQKVKPTNLNEIDIGPEGGEANDIE
jgi:hypothetical protein